MFFKRTHSYQSRFSAQDLKRLLIGEHVNIHNLDFEVMEREDATLRIIPHAEQVDDITTLPITKLEMKEQNGKTAVVITSHMRKLDSGGPMIIMIFCLFMVIVAAVLYFCKEIRLSGMLFGAGVLIFGIFWIRMQRGYFDYVRKIRTYVKSHESAVLA